MLAWDRASFAYRYCFLLFVFCAQQQASPLGQAVFEKLLKACGEVIWTDQTSILINGNICVEEPYEPRNVRLVAGKNGNKNTLDDGSLDRVKKIVVAALEEYRSKT